MIYLCCSVYLILIFFNATDKIFQCCPKSIFLRIAVVLIVRFCIVRLFVEKNVLNYEKLAVLLFGACYI